MLLVPVAAVTIGRWRARRKHDFAGPCPTWAFAGQDQIVHHLRLRQAVAGVFHTIISKIKQL